MELAGEAPLTLYPVRTLAILAFFFVCAIPILALLLIFLLEPLLYSKTAVKIYKNVGSFIIAFIIYELVKRYLI